MLLILLGLAISNNTFAQCDSGDIGGNVFLDLPVSDASTANTYGFREGNENALVGVIVTVVDAHGTEQLDTTDASGNWSVTPEFFPVRVEYTWPDTWLQISPGDQTNSDVQVFQSAACDTRLGLYYPDEYCQSVPDMTVSCFANGNPTGGGTSGAIDAIVSFPYDNIGDATAPTHDAIMSEVGAVWGAAYNRNNQQAFYGAVMKRHVGLGSAGIGGIYRIDYSGAAPVASAFVDLASIGVNLGIEPVRTLSADWSTPASDPLMFDTPGKMGIGDMEISEDGNTLFIVNLFERNIVAIDITAYNTSGTFPTAGDVTTLPALPDPMCTNGIARIFGLEYRRGMIYTGLVCTAESGGTAADLSAAVYAYDVINGGSWTTTVDPFSLDYAKGGAVDNTCTNWNPWIDTYDDFTINCRPTPMLTDIAFYGDDAIVLGFADRYAFQKFTFMQDVNGVNEENVVSGGDILRGYWNGTNYSIENNGIVPGGNGCGSNGEGIGGGEFFCGDSLGTEHSETALGALSILPGTSEVMATVINPVNFNSGGLRRFDMKTGTSGPTVGYQLYQTITFPGGNGNAAKGGGIGDVEMICNPAPLELLSFLWMDYSQDGVQDPSEPGIPNVEISLFDLSGNLLATTTTDANGLYTFSDTLAPSTSYYVAIGTNGEFDTGAGLLNGNLNLSAANSGTGTNADKHDSDVTIASGVNPAVDDFPYYQFTTGNAGQLVHNMDGGFFPPCTDPDLVPTDSTICAGATVDLKYLVIDVEPTTEFTGECYYFASLNDAQLEQAFLGPFQTPATTTTYYVRKNITDPACFDVDSIQIIVNPEPILITSSLELCDGDNTSLDLWAVEITGQSTTITYHTSLDDANAGVNALGSPVVSPTSTTTYYARASSDVADECADIGSIQITVNNCGFDLAMKMILDNNTPANPGDTVAHTIWVYNQGTIDAYNIEILAYLSPGIIFDNNINTNINWGQNTNLLTTTIDGPLTGGDSIAISLDLIVDPVYVGGTITNFVEITAYDDDTDGGNTPPVDLDSTTDSNVFNDQVIDNETNNNPDNPNDDDDHDSEMITVNQVFDLALLVDGPGNTVSPCDTVTYTMTVYNQGNMVAQDIVLTNYLPTDMTFDPTLPNNLDWELVGGLPTDTIPFPIGPGDEAIFTLDLVLDCAYGNTLLDNFFEITGYDDDADDNNAPPSDSDSVTDLDGSNDLNIDDEINNNPDNPNDDDDHDGFTLSVFQGGTPTTQTFTYTTVEGVSVNDICLPIDELSGAVNSVASCDDPENGTLPINSPDVCVDYTPNNGFTGQDTTCVLVCDVNALCDTSYIIITVNPLPTTVTDTVFVNTVQNITINNLCADISELLAPLDNVASCGDPDNGNLIVAPTDECVDYIPNNGFTGQDTACVVVCDDNALCDTTIFVITVNPLPVIDTIYITSVVDNNLPNICMDISQLSGAVSTTASCGDPVNGSLAISSPNECVGYFPNSGYIGPDTACVVLCDVNAICDSTIIVFNITPDCSGIVAEEDIFASLDNCGDTASICIPVPETNIGNFNIYDNGMPYSGTLEGCNFDTSFVFSYAILPGMGASGPYAVTAWTVNGTTYSGDVNDMSDLTDSLNVWNPTGNWTLDAPNNSITGGSTSDVFGNIEIAGETLMASMAINPNGGGTILRLPNGMHQIVLEDLFLGCFDTININVSCCTQLFTAPEELTTADCDSNVDFCTTISATNIFDYTVTDNGINYPGPFGICGGNAAVAIDTGYHELIFINNNTLCADTAFVTVNCSDCDDFVEDTSLLIDNCNGTADYCVNIDPNNPSGYEVRNDGVLFTGPYVGCDFDTLITYFANGFNLSGSYNLDEWIVNGTNYAGHLTISTTEELMSLMNNW
ncbi:MAG: SdrD B-like domain-containing protein, partial [Saprospiraceae bacterium]